MSSKNVPSAKLPAVWFTRNKNHEPPNPLRDEQLNEGLHLATEWGEQFMQPIQPRLASKYPALSPTELDELNATCQAAMKFGHSAVYDLARVSGKDTRSPAFETRMKRQYPWIDSRNLSRLFSQGM